YTTSIGSGGEDGYLIKTNFSGDTLWTRTLGNIYNERIASIFQTSDSGFILAGARAPGNPANDDLYLLKISQTGNVIWSKVYGGQKTDWATSVKQTTDGGYIITGGTTSISDSIGDVYLLKTDAVGDTLWTKTFGGVGQDVGENVIQTYDGGFLITGWSNSFGVGGFDGIFIKTDINGYLQWSKTFGGVNNDVFYSSTQMSDSGFISVGSTESFGSGGSDIYTVRTNKNGDTVWTKAYGTTWNQIGRSIASVTDSTLILGCYIDTGNMDGNMTLINQNGNVNWSTRFSGASNPNFGFFVAPCIDRGYVLSCTSSALSGGNGIFVIKTDSLGDSGCNHFTYPIITKNTNSIISAPNLNFSSGGNITPVSTFENYGANVTTLCFSVSFNEDPQVEKKLIAFPNPANTIINFTAEQLSGEMRIFNGLGEELFADKMTSGFAIDVSSWQCGVYYYSFLNTKIQAHGVFIVLH
ncbi:MAG TPA: hypothetical protein VI112_06250, partial [Bacteroidia bacterium]